MMNKKLLLIALPIVLTLSGCANTKVAMHNHMVEDTLAHEEVFGNLNDVSFAKKLTPNKALNEGELYTPILSFQHKDNNDGTYSVRFIATIESKEMDIVWTRSVHDLNGSTTNGKAKGTKQVNTVYESLNDNGERVWATSVEEKDDNEHTKPFNYYAVYCLLNIPNSVSSYYIDAFVTVTLGEVSKNSFVGSVNVADKTKHIKYSLEGGDRYVAEVNGEIRESDPLSGNNHLNLFSADLKANDKLRVYHLFPNSLTYARLDNAAKGKNDPDFSINNGELTALHDGIYNIFLNNVDNFYFEKKIYFMGPMWWEYDYAEPRIQLHEKNTNDYNDFVMESTGVDHQYSAFADVTREVKFFRKVGNNWNDQLGFFDFPTDGRNYYIQPLNDWYVFGEDTPTYEQTNFVFDEEALNTPQSIHTDDQAAYLNYSGEYYNITSNDLNSFNATGKVNSFRPNKATVSWDYRVPSGKSVSNYTFMYGQNSDLSDAYIVETTTNKSTSFYNAYLGDNYFRVIANLSDGSHDASPIKIFKVETQAPRNLSVGNMPNCRDMGGRTTYAGGKIKQGLIYRTAGNYFDNKTEVNSECKDILRNQLGVKTEINVSNNDGNTVALGGNVVVVNAYMDYGSPPYSNLSRNAERIRQVMNTLADIDNYPVFYHCRIGTDRTGITGMMIGGLIGIPFNEIMQDYCFSNFSPIDGQRYPHKPNDTNGDDCAKYLDEILALPGNTFQEQTYNALLSIGCPAEQLNTIIDIMTDGQKATLPTTAKIGKGTSLSSTGTKKTSTDFKNPDTYYVLTQNKEASFTTQLTAGNKTIVVYMGSTNSSSSTKIASCISLKIDGVEKTIVDKSLFNCGFGETSNNHRTAYMFNLLGEYNIATGGQHTITITVKNNNTFNMGTICVFDAD